MTTAKRTRKLPAFEAADGNPIRPSEYRLALAGNASVDEANLPTPEAIVEGTFKARATGLDLERLKRKGRPGYRLEAKLDLEELVVTSITVPEPDPSLFENEEDDEG